MKSTKSTDATPLNALRLLKHLRPRFGLRGLLFIFFLLGLPLAWMAREHDIARRQHQAAVTIERHHGHYGRAGQRWFYGYSKSPSRTSLQIALLGDDTFRDVSYISFFRKSSLTDEELGQFTAFPKINSISADNSRVTDVGLTRISSMKLWGVSFDGCNVSDAGVAALSNNSSLKRLSLANTKITDKGLKVLSLGPADLEAIDLSRTQITDAGVEYLTRFTSLKELKLAGVPITDAGLSHVGRLSQLHQLDLSGTRITDDGVGHLANLRDLSNVNLTCTAVSDIGIGQLPNLGASTWLLGYTCITDESIPILLGENYCVELWLRNTAITDAGVRTIAECNRVTRLDLRGTSVTQIALHELIRLEQLDTLFLNDELVDTAPINELKSLRPHLNINDWHYDYQDVKCKECQSGDSTP